VHAHLDDELSAEQAAELAERVMRDPRLRAYLDELTAVRAQLRALADVEPPSRAGRRAEAAPASTRRWETLAAFATAAAVFLCGLWLSRPTQAPLPDDQGLAAQGDLVDVVFRLRARSADSRPGSCLNT